MRVVIRGAVGGIVLCDMADSEQAEFERNAAYHAALAEQYDLILAGDTRNHLARRAFRELVMRETRPGGTILDFGCGTGLDAQEYARSGYHVVAYDNSPGMMKQMRARCAGEIASGLITPYSMPYMQFLEAVRFWPEPDTVSANFAVLNSIPDPGRLFAAIADRMAPTGCVVVSILNPSHWTKIARSVRHTRILATEPYTTYLHPVDKVSQSAARFRLAGRANAGAAVRYAPVSSGGGRPVFWRGEGPWRVKELLWRTPLYRLFGQFTFLLFRRND